jgi:hypothetical protein
MADKKIEKALYGPSTTEVALGALLGFVVGVAVAVVFLVTKPVLKVPALPKPVVANVIYLVPGSESSTKGRTWQGKLKTLTAGGEVSLSEEELNAFAATLALPAAPVAPAKPGAAPAKPAKPPEPPKPGEPAKPGDAAKTSENLFSATELNFKITKDDKLQVSAKCAINYYGIGTDAYVVATGTFARSGDYYVFQPDTYYFGSCPLHKLPMGSAFVTSRILASFKLPDSMHAWDKIKSIKVEGGLLKVATAQ